MGEKTLSGGWECVEKMGVGWGVWSWPVVGTNKMGREKCSSCAWSREFGKM